MPKTRTLPDVLESMRALLENRKVKCPGCGLQCDCVPGTDYHCTNHYKCGGTGQILNPAYAPLLALVRDSDPQGPGDTCADYWAAAPDGALEGALKKVLIPLMPSVLKYDPAFALWEDVMAYLTSLHNTKGDTRIPAAMAVEKWLKGGA